MAVKIMAIDMHAHWIPKALSDVLRKRTERPKIGLTSDGQEFIDCELPSLRVPKGFDDLATRLADMERNGITHGVLSLSTVYGVEGLPLGESIALCRLYNDSISAACATHPERFSGLAALPGADLEAMRAELERALELPGMVGALLPGDGFLSVQRAERFRPLFEAAERHRSILLIHYGRLFDDPDAPRADTSDNAHARIGTLDMQARLSSNMITFCLSDFLADYPNVTVLSHNLGGNLPFEVERLDHRILVDRPGDELPSRRIRAARVLVDCNSFGARAIERAVEVYGADRIVLGSDGTDFGMKWSRDAIAGARITEAEKQAILDGNAASALARVKRPRAAAAA
ncbi:MAG TPA: amidohydrolase family protein [Candidatus Binataceae bacterium]|nr:amidohydrolase family protein [Candidatus Binataceae bacterium]